VILKIYRNLLFHLNLQYKYDLAGASAAGRVEITFPNTDLDSKEKELKVVGNFECWIDKQQI